jgi:hypothetical protein
MHDTLNSVIDSFEQSEKRYKQAVDDVKLLRTVLQLAFNEINEIHARDGVPYKACGMRSSVAQSYFTSVVNMSSEALDRTNRPEYKEPLCQ